MEIGLPAEQSKENIGGSSANKGFYLCCTTQNGENISVSMEIFFSFPENIFCTLVTVEHSNQLRGSIVKTTKCK